MTKKTKKVELPEPIYTLKQAGEFGFVRYENAQRVAMAFALARYKVSIRQENSSYIVEIYTNDTSLPLSSKKRKWK